MRLKNLGSTILDILGILAGLGLLNPTILDFLRTLLGLNDPRSGNGAQVENTRETRPRPMGWTTLR